MTEGHDGTGGQADESGDSREYPTESEWDQPWPSERNDDRADGGSGRHRSESGHPGPGDSPVDDTGQTDGSGSETVDNQDPATQDQDETHSEDRTVKQDSHSMTRQGATQATDDGTVDEIHISRAVRGTEGWVDLGESRPDGNVLSPENLSEEELRAYITDERSLHSLVQFQWGVRVSLGSMVAGLVSTWGLTSAGFDARWGIALTGLLFVLGFIWVLLFYRRWVYQIRADSIYLERGVVTHVRSLVPYVRIQHVDTKRSFFERMLGLSTLVVYTAGSRGADVTIPGLLPDEASDLQRRVKELAIEAEGDDAL